MAHIDPPPTTRARQRRRQLAMLFPTLGILGLAVEHFPRYVNTKPRRLHALDVVLMSFIVRGRGRHIMGNHEFVETGGSIGITHYGQLHDILTDKRGMEIFNIYVDLQNHALPVIPESFQAILTAMLPLHPRLQNTLNRRVRFTVTQPQRLTHLLHGIEREIQLFTTGSEEIIRSLFQVFLIECCRQAQQSGLELSVSESNSFPVWVEKLRMHLDATYTASHTIETLANRFNISKGFLCRAFKDYVGQTVFEYLINRRIQSAMFALRRSNDKVLSIALDCGFNDLTYFNRKFKSIVGQSPTQYRKLTR